MEYLVLRQINDLFRYYIHTLKPSLSIIYFDKHICMPIEIMMMDCIV